MTREGETRLVRVPRKMNSWAFICRALLRRWRLSLFRGRKRIPGSTTSSTCGRNIQLYRHCNQETEPSHSTLTSSQLFYQTQIHRTVEDWITHFQNIGVFNTTLPFADSTQYIYEHCKKKMRHYYYYDTKQNILEYILGFNLWLPKPNHDLENNF